MSCNALSSQLAPLVRERAGPDRFMTSSTEYGGTVVSPSGVHPQRTSGLGKRVDMLNSCAEQYRLP
jgi:hypothetical protein